MEIGKENDLFQIMVSRDELRIIANCLNETLENVEPFEFYTRVGAEISEVEHLLDTLGRAYRKA